MSSLNHENLKRSQPKKKNQFYGKKFQDQMLNIAQDSLFHCILGRSKESDAIFLNFQGMQDDRKLSTLQASVGS